MKKLHQTWNHWKFKYLTLVVLGFISAFYLAANENFNEFLLQLGSFEYIGAFFAGILFVSSFTMPISAVIFVILSHDIHPVALGLIGGSGAVAGDLVIFKLVKDHLVDELKELVGDDEVSELRLLFRSRYLAWTLPIIGGLIIASPLPDELGVSVLSMSKVSENRFITISFISNAFGILAIASIAKVL